MISFNTFTDPGKEIPVVQGGEVKLWDKNWAFPESRCMLYIVYCSGRKGKGEEGYGAMSRFYQPPAWDPHSLWVALSIAVDLYLITNGEWNNKVRPHVMWRHGLAFLNVYKRGRISSEDLFVPEECPVHYTYVQVQKHVTIQK